MSVTRTESNAEILQLLLDISNTLTTGLTEQQLAICVKLIETGVNPNALANVIKTLIRESAAIDNASQNGRT